MIRTETLSQRLTSVLIATAAVWSVHSAVEAGEIGNGKDFGIGIVVGYPDLGVSLNVFLDSAMSIQVDPVIRYHNGKDDDDLALGGRIDLLFWMPALASVDAGDLRWYWGPGASIGLGLGNDHAIALGAELPVGLGFQFDGAPIDLTTEAVPVLELIEDVEFGIGGALNARWYF